MRSLFKMPLAALACAAMLAACSVSQQATEESKVIAPTLSKAEAPTLATVKPPGNPKRNHFHISEKQLASLPVPKQAPELAKALADLQTGSLEERKARLRAKVIADMVYVRGGSFMRGDFASLMNIEGVTRMTYKEDDKVVKEITLSDFWIGRYKTTYAEFDVFTDATGRPRTGMEYDGKYHHPLLPARSYWQEAKDYCLWLGELTGLPMDLPTEAQWEYAARSRGQFFMVPTDDGNVEYGRNVPYAAQEEVLSPVGPYFGRYPVGLFPPNPLGLYDMSTDGTEWVNDWYAVDAYEKAEPANPKGPPTGDRKVMRSGASDSPLIGSAVHRYSELLIPMRDGVAEERGRRVPMSTTSSPSLRCAAFPL